MKPNLFMHPVSMASIILLFLQSHLLFMVAADLLSSYSSDNIAINCGSTATSTAFDGREWIGDVPSQLKGSSVSATSMEDLTNTGHVPCKTARISQFRFSYVFQVSPGQKLIRLHFNPVLYRGFNKYKDLFTVEASPFTLLGNFSASLTANSLGVKYFLKEFFMNVEQNRNLTLQFSPDHSESHDTYAFINGIEVISVPSSLYYTHDGDVGAEVIGQKSRVFVDNSFALEPVQRSNIRRDVIPSNDDYKKVNKSVNFTWRASIDVGFGYLVRLHFSETKLSDGIEFNVVMNDHKIADTELMMSIQEKSLHHIPKYQDYVVVMKGHKQDGRRDLVIALQLKGDEFSNGPLKAFEIFKMSNPDNSLVSPNPLPPSQALPSTSAPHRVVPLLIFGRGNEIANCAILMITLLNIIIYKLRQVWEANSAGESNTQVASVEGICRRFSLAEILLATKEFSDELVIGKGGFGKVYKSFINKGQDIVAVKRLNSNSKQGAHEFWTEVETLSKLRHVHLVSLVGYCNESQEMILVYEYMPHGTLADHLYKLYGQSTCLPNLSWEERLKICIGAARGLDYLHTGTDYGVIHRDVKASNILLDDNFVAKVSDFGLAKVRKIKQLQSSVSTNVKGTFGYLDPNYFLTRKLTKKADVYAFGVVLLEVICGRPAVDLQLPENERSLSIWAKNYIIKGEIDKIVATDLRGQISDDCLKSFVQISEKCLLSDPRKRPTMAHLVSQLEFVLDQHERTKSLMPTETTGATDETTQTATSSEDEQNIYPSSKSIQNIAFPAYGTPHKRKSISYNKPLRLWPWEPFWNKTKMLKMKDIILPVGPNCHLFTISDILASTKNFDDNLIIASDDFYIVYKGLIKSCATKVAVARAKHVRGDKFFNIRAEIEMFSQVSHPNLASVIGYCYYSNDMIVVYHYVSNSTLCDYLYNHKTVLSWKHRLQICIDAAQGLKHLHNESIIHRDVRPANIFLAMNGVAKLLSFGFHSLGSLANFQGAAPTEYLPPGTQYLAPEFFSSGELTEKSDVYSFGLVLLEMVCGTRTINNKRDRRDHYLPNQVKRSIQRKKLHQIIDPYLRGKIAAACLNEFLEVALRCLVDQPTSRPSMDNVVQGLELALEAQVTAEAESLRNIECPNLLDGAFHLQNVQPSLSFLESTNFPELHQVFDSVASFEYDESLARDRYQTDLVILRYKPISSRDVIPARVSGPYN